LRARLDAALGEADAGLDAALNAAPAAAPDAAPEKQLPAQPSAVPLPPAPPVPLPSPQIKPGPEIAKAQRGKLVPILVGVIAVLALGVAGAAYWLLRPSPAVLPMGILELNATPYAEVVSITSEKGKAVLLPAGDHWTPMRLDGIPAGRYAVSFKEADGSIKSQQCDAAPTEQLCTIEMKPVDDPAIEEIIGGAK
jgi:hypothetical protein